MEPSAPAATKARAPLGALKPLLPYALRHRGRIALAFVALLVASAATLAVPFAVRRMIDYGFSEGRVGLIHHYFIAMFGVVAVLALASGSRFYLVMTLGERVVADLRGDLFAHLTKLDPGFFDQEKTGEIVSLEIPLPLSPYPIKVRAIVRYRQGLRYGFEFLTLSTAERDTIRRVCEMLATKS